MYTIDFQKPIHVHFIGIGGISMSGLAEILLNRHFTVTGSDMQASDMTKHLEETGAKVVIGQKSKNITDDIDLVVYTAAIHESNEEFAAAKNKGIPMMTRAALLGPVSYTHLDVYKRQTFCSRGRILRIPYDRIVLRQEGFRHRGFQGHAWQF